MAGRALQNWGTAAVIVDQTPNAGRNATNNLLFKLGTRNRTQNVKIMIKSTRNLCTEMLTPAPSIHLLQNLNGVLSFRGWRLVLQFR